MPYVNIKITREGVTLQQNLFTVMEHPLQAQLCLVDDQATLADIANDPNAAMVPEGKVSLEACQSRLILTCVHLSTH